MKYKITRSSDWFGENKPCKKAYKEDGDWYVDINTLGELQDLIREVEWSVIVGTSEIEIYDSYRE